MKQEILLSLLEWNPWYEGKFPENLIGIKREYNSLSYLDIEEIKILGGAKWTGKSTLLYKVMKQAIDQKKGSYISIFKMKFSQNIHCQIFITVF